MSLPNTFFHLKVIGDFTFLNLHSTLSNFCIEFECFLLPFIQHQFLEYEIRVIRTKYYVRNNIISSPQSFAEFTKVH